MRAFLFALALLCAAPAFAQTTWIGSYVWQNDDPAFGGFSGIALSENGTDFLAISDRGSLAKGQLSRTDGAITAVTLDAFAPLLDASDAPLPRAQSDSEGIALTADGGFYISFEWTHGVRYFSAFGAQASALSTTPAFDALQNNSSLEALAIDAEGALYTVPERSGAALRPFPVFKLKAGVWTQPFDIPRTGPYLISGADIGPDGLLYILERDFVGIGFRSRVRRFALDGSGEETLLETPIWAHDNLEGISVWQDETGLRMTLISDDNFRTLQRTEIVEYRLTP